MIADFVEEPRKWQIEQKRCRFCGHETEHQWATSEAWICLECGTYWTTPEERETIRAEVANLTPEDVWGGE